MDVMTVEAASEAATVVAAGASDHNLIDHILTGLSWIIPLVSILAGGSWIWIKIMVLNPLRRHIKQIKAIERIIPIDALEKELMLQTTAECKELIRPVVENQEKLRRIIPSDAIEKGLTLQTCYACKNEREHCSVNCIVEELATDIKSILNTQNISTKKIITALTTLTNRLPLKEGDRETIMKELI